MASTLGVANPLTYRGYVYDTESGLYYLQSRYYDPEVGRFLNADALVSTGQGLLGNNMFAYCLNNPAAYLDDTGTAAMVCFSYDVKEAVVPWRNSAGGSTNYNGGMSTLPVAPGPYKKRLDLFVATASPSFSSKDPQDLPIYYQICSANIEVNGNNLADLSYAATGVIGSVVVENGAPVFKPMGG